MCVLNTNGNAFYKKQTPNFNDCKGFINSKYFSNGNCLSIKNTSFYEGFVSMSDFKVYIYMEGNYKLQRLMAVRVVFAIKESVIWITPLFKEFSLCIYVNVEPFFFINKNNKKFVLNTSKIQIKNIFIC